MAELPRRRMQKIFVLQRFKASFIFLFVACNAILLYNLASGNEEKSILPRKFLHIADIHLDLSYAVGAGAATCDLPPCCRKPVGVLADPILSTMSQSDLDALKKEDEEDVDEDEQEDEDDFFFLGSEVSNSDVNNRKLARKFGEYDCDSPLTLLQSALKAQKFLMPDFIVWTGDTGPHRKSGTGHMPRKDLIKTIVTATEAFANATAPDMKVVPCLGNYDFSPIGFDPGPASSKWLLDAVADSWSRWLPQDSTDMLRTHGYYQMPLGDNLRAIVLNTQECDIRNFFTLVREESDSNGDKQLDWLRISLQEAESAGDNVLIVGHIPPGIWSGCYGNFTEKYERILSDFPRTVSGQVFGHRHSGSWRILKDENGTSSSVALITPSLTPFTGQNPSFRIYHMTQPESKPEHGWPDIRPALAITSMGQFSANLAQDKAEDEDLTWDLTFYLPGSLPFNRTSMSPSQFEQSAKLMQEDKEVGHKYRFIEANARPYMFNPREASSWTCALTAIKTRDLIECAHLAEEVLIKHYVNQDHNYVLTNLFPFEIIYNYFCNVFYNLSGDPSCDERIDPYV